MASLNKVILIGNVGSDPEIKNLNNGSVANLRVATSEVWKDRDGNRQEKTEWHNVTIWNDRLVDFVEKYIKKGQQVYVEGKLQTRKWQDQSGNDRYSTEIVIEKFNGEIKPLGPRPESSNERQSQNRGQESGRVNNRDNRRESDNRGGYSDMDDDIPF